MARYLGDWMSWTLHLLLCGLCLVVDITLEAKTTLDPSEDYRVITYEELLQERNVYLFSHPDIVDYARLTLDIPRQQILVGARNYLLRLDLSDLHELQKVEWEPTDVAHEICQAKGQKQEECHNFIRVLMVHHGRVFACGTNAFSPWCSWRQAKDLAKILEAINGVGKAPYNPHHNNTAVMTENGALYSGTVLDFVGRDSAIYRQMGEQPSIRTVRYNSKWLNDPDFVSSYDIGDYVYFFFRESAVEYINCGKSVYSRVVRVCKTDMGGDFLLDDNWTTFVKARLNCSLPGQYPFYFNHLQSTYYSEEEGLLYAAFSTSPTSMYGSAVCIYNLTAFDAAFHGAYKYQENSQAAWMRIPNSAKAKQCPNYSSKRSLVPKQKQLVEAQKFQMMDSAVQPKQLMPSVVVEQERWSHLVVDQVVGRHHERFAVMFVATIEGVVKKMLHLPGTNQSCLIEEIHVAPSSKQQPIKSLHLHSSQSVLFVSTHDHVYRIPVQRCHRFKTKQRCLGAMDPYCGWHDHLKQCVTRPTYSPAHFWHQNISSCPITDFPVDGEWSPWSSWRTCHHVGNHRRGEECLCRDRTCDNPKPRSGGSDCSGITMEVANCTSNGGWTEWSEWSHCSVTCGVAVRSRHRSCGNPEPRYGGRVCVGPAMDEQYCHDSPKCPVQGGWSSWSKWTACTAHCGGGVHRRRRQCLDPAPADGGRECVGTNEEWRMCNNQVCEELRRATDWSSWRRTNQTDEGFIEERYRCVCKANVPDSRLLRGHLKMDARFCPNGDNCGDSAPPLPPVTMKPHDGQWTLWSSWTPCDAACGGGIQWRERVCSSSTHVAASHECIGHGREARECNLHSCQGVWSCWSDFSTCSVTCGRGRKWRKRTCEASIPGREYNNPCLGNDLEEIPCKMPPCDPQKGWGEWTLWSVCFHDNTQQRKRECRMTFNMLEDCEGPEIETRMCRNDMADVRVAASSSHASHRQLQAYHLVIVAIAAFALGGLVCVGVFLYCQRQHKANQEEKYHQDIQFGTLTKHEVKPNIYMSPSQLSMSTSLNNQYNYSMGSLSRTKDPQKMTVKEATLKRNSLMRTNLSLTDL